MLLLFDLMKLLLRQFNFAEKFFAHSSLDLCLENFHQVRDQDDVKALQESSLFLI